MPTTVEVVEIPIKEIKTSKNNPRKIRDNDPHVKGIAESIHAQGLISPIVVRKPVLKPMPSLKTNNERED